MDFALLILPGSSINSVFPAILLSKSLVEVSGFSLEI